MKRTEAKTTRPAFVIMEGGWNLADAYRLDEAIRKAEEFARIIKKEVEIYDWKCEKSYKVKL